TDESAVDVLPVEEPVLQEPVVEVSDLDKPVVSAISASEIPEESTAADILSKPTESVIVDSNEDAASQPLPADSEQSEDPTRALDQNVVIEQQPATKSDLSSEEPVASVKEPDADQGIEIITAESDLGVLSEQAVVTTEESAVEPSVTSDAKDTAVSAVDSPSTDQPSAEPTSEEPVVVEPSIVEESATSNVPSAISADKEVEITEKPLSAKPTIEEEAVQSLSSSIDDVAADATAVDPATESSDAVRSETEDAVALDVASSGHFADDSNVEPVIGSALVVGTQASARSIPENIALEAPILETAGAEEVADVSELVAEPIVTPDHDQAISYEAVAADPQVPNAVADVTKQPSDSPADITAELEPETEKDRGLGSTVVDEPSLLTSLGADMADIAAGVALSTAAVGIGLSQYADSIQGQPRSIEQAAEANIGQENDNKNATQDEGLVEVISKDASEPTGQPVTLEQPKTEAGAIDSEPEVIEYEGSNISPSSPFELVDSVGESDVEREASESQAVAKEQADIDTGSASPLVPADIDESHSPPVVVGTIEEVQQPVLEQPPIEDVAVVKDEPVDTPISELNDSRTPQDVGANESKPENIVATRAILEPSSQPAPSMITPDVAAWNSPHSQMSYNRTDSQISLSPPVETPSSADDESARPLSKRDSAIYMDKSAKEASVPTDEMATTLELQDADDDQVAPSEMPVQGSDTASIDQEAPPSVYSTFSTPAFPQYFSHSDAPRQQQQLQDQQQPQQVGASIQRHEVPRASDIGKRPAKATRPKDVLMELNIETPEDGRQLMQLRVTDDLDEVCEAFCAQYNMMDLLPGMKSLVRGKVERRLARRRERALQLAAASAREKNIA
ncbi:hypothetical protein GGI11_001378, partial [Coemansia sp. RSA 2049]